MLIVTRRVGETIVINDQIRVCVVATSHGHITQIGIDAPKKIPVVREELIGKAAKPHSQ